MDINLIVAIGRNGEIGKEGELIWKISEDLKHFKSLTMGHPVIMGRKTWESLPKKPLPGRKNIILTRQKDLEFSGALIVNDIKEAIAQVEGESAFIIGGAEIYNTFLPLADKLYLTHIDAECKEADVFLNIDQNGWQIVEESPIHSTPEGLQFHYSTLKRVDK